MAFFAVLFNKTTPVLMFALAYIMPNIRYAINFGFATQLKTNFLAIYALKILCALISFLFGSTVTVDSKSSGKSVISTSGITSTAGASTSTAL